MLISTEPVQSCRSRGCHLSAIALQLPVGVQLGASRQVTSPNAHTPAQQRLRCRRPLLRWQNTWLGHLRSAVTHRELARIRSLVLSLNQSSR